MQYTFTSVLVSIMLLALQPATARTLYVRTDGADEAGRTGLTASSAWKTVAYAAGRATGRGDTIRIGTGLFPETQRVLLSPGVSLIGEGPTRTILTTNRDDVVIEMESKVPTKELGKQTVQALTIDGQARHVTGIHTTRRDSLSFTDLVFRNCRAGALSVYGLWEDGIETHPPSFYIHGIYVTRIDITNCGQTETYGGGAAIFIGSIDGAELSNIKIVNQPGISEAHGIKFVAGWLRNVHIHHCDITVPVITSGPWPGQAFPIEFFHLAGGNRVHDVTGTGSLSFVGGYKGNSAYSIEVYNNRLTENGGVELALSDANVHHNVFESGIMSWGTGNSFDNPTLDNNLIHHNTFLNGNPSDTDIGVLQNRKGMGLRVYNNTFVNVAEPVRILSSAAGPITNFQIYNNLALGNTHLLGGTHTASTGAVAARNFSDRSVSVADPSSPVAIRENRTGNPGLMLSGQKPQPYYAPSGAVSPLVNAGLNVGLAYLGVMPDIGAYELGQPVQVIRSFAPAFATPGSRVSLTGTGFTGVTEVQFNGVPALFTPQNDTAITATVPPGAAPGPLSVTSAAGISYSALPFSYPYPIVTAAQPAQAEIGASITLRGKFFTGLTRVRFNGVPALSFTVPNDSTATVVIPVGATSGRLELTNAVGTSTENYFYQVLLAPVITSMDPTDGPPISVVTLAGRYFTGTTAVRFGELEAASFLVDNDSTLRASVPHGVRRAKIAVQNPVGTGYSPREFGPDEPTATEPSPAHNPPEAFPNPAGTWVQLSGPTPTAGAWTVTVLDLLGHDLTGLLSPIPATRLTLDVSRLPPGCYVLRFDTAAQVFTRRLIIAR